jgi:hypothetical protein
MDLMKLALEGWGKLSAFDAELKVDEAHLDHAKMKELSQHTSLLEALDHWILIPDMSMRPRLQELAGIVNELYGFSAGLEVYRGFDPLSPYQDTMNLSTKGFFRNTVIPHEVGHEFVYSNKANPLSFSTSIRIAQAFGSTIVRCHLVPAKESFLVITDELCAIICERRNIAPVTQKEVIVFPPYELHCHVLER